MRKTTSVELVILVFLITCFSLCLIGKLNHRTERTQEAYCEKIQPEIQTEKPKYSETVMGLIEAGKIYPGAKVCESEIHPLLMQLAADQANYMATHHKQGHQNFQLRFDRVMQSGIGTATEICAESWARQVNDTKLDLGKEMFKCWRQSPGHWSVASKKHKYFGAEMAKGGDIWYACILVAD